MIIQIGGNNGGSGTGGSVQVPSKVSAFINDVGYITMPAVEAKGYVNEQFLEQQGYATSDALSQYATTVDVEQKDEVVVNAINSLENRVKIVEDSVGEVDNALSNILGE